MIEHFKWNKILKYITLFNKIVCKLQNNCLESGYILIYFNFYIIELFNEKIMTDTMLDDSCIIKLYNEYYSWAKKEKK